VLPARMRPVGTPRLPTPPRPPLPQYFCERCACKVDAERGLALRRLPRVLALQLKRFRYDLRLGQRFKINDRFRFPTTIDMAEYVRALPGMTQPAEAEPSAARPATATGQAAHAADGLMSSVHMEMAECVRALPGAVQAAQAADGSLGRVDAMEVDSEVPAPVGASVAGTGACGAPIGTCGATDGACVADTAELCEQPDASRVPLPHELYGVLVHSGSALFGHYFALIKARPQEPSDDGPAGPVGRRAVQSGPPRFSFCYNQL
jgi:hypothetical protein